MSKVIEIVGFEKLLDKVDNLILLNDSSFSNETYIIAAGAFLGAFFAFLFERLASSLDKKRERYLKHKNSMVKTEYVVVKHQDQSSRIIALLKGSAGILKDGNFTNDRFPKLNVIDGLELDMGDIDLINKVADYWLSVERVNNDLSSINRILETLQKVVLSGVEPDMRNFEHLVQQMEALAKFLDGPFMNENLELNAYILILLEIDKTKHKLIHLFLGYKISKHEVTQDKIESFVKLIENEIEMRVKEDTKRLSV